MHFDVLCVYAICVDDVDLYFEEDDHHKRKLEAEIKMLKEQLASKNI